MLEQIGMLMPAYMIIVVSNDRPTKTAESMIMEGVVTRRCNGKLTVGRARKRYGKLMSLAWRERKCIQRLRTRQAVKSIPWTYM